MFASNSVSLPRLDNPTGVCPTHRRQWADFLVSLMAPLHRQYKTARTETRWHLLLKIGQMPTQTAASRGYVLFRGAIRDTHKSPTNCLPGCGHDPRSAPNLERHGSSKMQTFGWLEIPHFLNRISRCIPSEIEEDVFLIYYFSRQKGPSASSDSPSFSFIGSIIFISTPSLVRAWNLRSQ